MNIALSTRQFFMLLFVALIALCILSFIMLYSVAHIDVFHLILSYGSSILPQVTYPHG